MTKRILIADDEPAVRQLLELVLTSQGYEVQSAQNGDQLVRIAQELVPDLALVDLMMPGVDGYEAIRQLRNDTRTAHIPTIILTARSAPNEVVTGFESGADDYIIKPFNIPELLARIKSHLRRAAQRPVHNPLTGLPGNILLTEELKHRIRRGEPFALMHIDLNNFKAFNDTYGFARGDRMIKLVAEVLVDLVRTVGTPTDFIGHIGGDDFVVLTTPEQVDQLCPQICKDFDDRARALYDTHDLERGYLQAFDRQGIARRFPIISVSIGVATNQHRTFADYEEAGRVAADMKHYAKQQPGSYYAVDVRSGHTEAPEDDRRGRRLPVVLTICGDAALLAVLRSALNDHGYRLLEAPGIPEAHALLAHNFGPALIVADGRLGPSLWEFADACRTDLPDVPLVVFSPRADDADTGFAHGARAFLKLPFRMQQFVACVAQFARREE
jgi:diguanylate cyclase (GGDEF)-like protein